MLHVKPLDPDARSKRDAAAQALLLIVAIGCAWLPVETRPFTAVGVATVVLSLTVWGWLRSGSSVRGLMGVAAAVGFALCCSSISGWDPARSIGELGLAATVTILVWLASRTRPPEAMPAMLAVGLVGLSVWGLWQVATGLEAVRSGIDLLASTGQTYAAERVASRRAFASLPVPGHLAVLLATALPLLVARTRRSKTAIFWAAAVALAVVGLAATRSPVGLGLALVAVAPLVVQVRKWMLIPVIAVLLAATVGVIVARPDVVGLEPVSLRMDNWRTGVWLWSTSPAAGVGVSSFAQASQANPLTVGNRPAHAHSLPVEALAELGPVGLAAVLLFGLWLARLAYDVWRIDRAVALAVLVVPLHNLVDFSLFVTGVAIPWAVLLGWAVALRGGDRPRNAAPANLGRTALVAAVSLGLGVAALDATSVVVEEAAALSPQPAESFTGALQALRLAPWRVEPQFLLASAAIGRGDTSSLDRAWRVLDKGRRVRPDSASLAERRARLALARGDVSTALAELWMASEFGSPGRSPGLSFEAVVEEISRTDDATKR